MKAPAKANRPRHARCAYDVAGIGELSAADDANHRRLPGTVYTENPDAFALFNSQTDIVEHRVPSGFDAITLADIL